MPSHILDHSKVILTTWFKFLGICPIDFVQHENGSVSLVQPTKCTYFLRATLSTLAISSLSATNYALFRHYSVEELWKFMLHVNNSITDLLSMVTTVLAFQWMYLVLIMKFPKLGNDLEELHHLFKAYSEIDLNVKQEKMRLIRALMIMFGVLCMVTMPTAFFGFSLWLQAATIDKQLHIAYYLWHGLCESIHGLFTCMPLLYFLTVYGEVFASIFAWIDSLLKSDNSPQQLLQKAMNLAKILEKTKRMYSSCIMHVFTGSLLVLVCILFRAIAFFVGSNQRRFSITMVATGYILLGLTFMDLLFFFCLLSQDLLNQINLLKIKLTKMKMACDKVEIDGKIYPVEYARNLTLSMLGNFVGFSASGYFNLNKPLISNLSSTFVTYIIVLIQFKMSETAMAG